MEPSRLTHLINQSRVSRRGLLTTTAVAALAPTLASCGGFTSGGSDDSSSDTLTFTTWGTDAELTGFKAAISSFEKANSGSKIALNAVPYEQMFTNIDAQIQAGNPPDVFRVPYYTFGAYAGAGQLLDLSSYLEGGFSDRFTPQAWAAVQGEQKPFGVPHHTDTSVVLYNKDVFASAGITSVPTSLDQAWTWEEFRAVAQQLRSALPKTQYPFAYNWQGNGVTRWLSWLFEADGRFLSEDLKTAEIDSDAGRSAVDFTRGFFADKLVPPNSSVKSTTYAADLWYAQTVAMTFGGAFLLPDTDATVDFEWGATYSPRDVRAGGDFGGNALVATAGTKRPELAAKFLDHVTQTDPQRVFCEAASLLPTRADLISDGIDFSVRGDLAPVFIGQASTVQAQDSGQVASPSMSAIITVLQDQLEQAFVGGQDTATTLTGLSDGIGSAVAG